jgi:hypothetical protein
LRTIFGAIIVEISILFFLEHGQKTSIYHSKLPRFGNQTNEAHYCTAIFFRDVMFVLKSYRHFESTEGERVEGEVSTILWEGHINNR